MKVHTYSVRLDEDRIPMLVREKEHYKVDGRFSFDNPHKIYELATDIGLDSMADEYMYCVCMDSKFKITGLFEASHGTVNASIVGIREVFQKALMLGAVHIVLVHNHPSGDPTPSAKDIEVTKQLIEAGKILQVDLADHVVVGNRVFYSMKNESSINFG